MTAVDPVAPHELEDGLLAGEDFLVYGEDWGFHPSTTEHLFRVLLQHNLALWVNALGLRAPRLDSYTIRRAWSLLCGRGASSVEQPPAGIRVYRPLALPLAPSRPVRWWNRKHLIRGIARQLEAMQLRAPIFLSTSPNAAEIVGHFQEKLVVYLCLDEYAEMPHFYAAYTRDMEAALLERADLVFATSHSLAVRKSSRGRPAIVLPQGVDFEHFHGRLAANAPEPPDLAKLPSPRFGFVGMLAPWVNPTLLLALARAYPKASVVLIGPVHRNIDQLRECSNIFLLGPRPYSEIPRYLAHFDVGLIPFEINALTQSVNPLKLLEYMACGLPVVSVAIAEVAALGRLVYCASSASEFVHLAGCALREGAAGRAARIEYARANSWKRRAQQFSAHLYTALRNRSLT